MVKSAMVMIKVTGHLIAVIEADDNGEKIYEDMDEGVVFSIDFWE